MKYDLIMLIKWVKNYFKIVKKKCEATEQEISFELVWKQGECPQARATLAVLNLGSISYSLCDLGHMSSALCPSVYSFLKRK